jgi:hypothetical protein
VLGPIIVCKGEPLSAMTGYVYRSSVVVHPADFEFVVVIGTKALNFVAVRFQASLIPSSSLVTMLVLIFGDWGLLDWLGR